MKHITLYIALAAVAILAACNTKELSEREKLDSRTVATLDVQYLVDGQPAQTLAYSHEFSRPVVQVQLNDEGLRWNLESNRDWCRVVPGEHRGSGTVMLELDANESFEDRESATLTFIAGGFRGFRIQVEQYASTFLLSQPYFVSGKDGGEFLVDVTTPEGVEWAFDTDADWVTADTEGEPVTEEGQTVTRLKLTAAADEDASRLGTVRLSAGLEKEAVNIWQFGSSDFEWAEDGKILLPSAEGESFSIPFPRGLVKYVTVPRYASYDITALDDETERVTISLTKNYSDLNKTRDVEVTVSLTNNATTEVALPSMKQDYESAGALVTPEGLQAFAERIAAGESVADWENEDGWVTLLNDIDMDGITGWQGIGTKQHPFSGMFDGKGHSILNLKGSPSGIFNYCVGADESDVAIIKNLTVDSSCTFYCDRGEWMGGAALGGIVNWAENANIIGCSCKAARIQLVGDGDDDSPAWFGGIVGKGTNEVAVRTCVVGDTGKDAVPTQLFFSANTIDGYVGGIAGEVQYVSGCSSNASITNTGSCTNLYMGGITSVVTEEDVVSGNSFKGSITLGGNSSQISVGGLYAALTGGARSFDNTSDMSESRGSITVKSFTSNSATRVFVGGMFGRLGKETSLSVKGYTLQTSIKLDYTSTLAAEHLCAGGLLGGCEIADADKCAGIDVQGVINQGTIPVDFKTSVAVNVRRSCLGGLIGLVNGPATFTGCSNQAKGELGIKKTGDSAYGAKSNGYTMIMGGIAGLCYGGDMTFDGCENSAALTNNFYTNSGAATAWSGSHSAAATGGIVGAFNYKTSPENISAVISNCSSKSVLTGYRGFLGGIAGFAYGATITDCSWEGSSMWTTSKKEDNQASFKGGIIGGLGKGEIGGCTAKGNLYAVKAGSAESADAAGIVARIMGDDEVKVNSCLYFGDLKVSQTTGELIKNVGGIVAFSTDDTKVSNCKYGGSVDEIPISSDNVSNYVIGNAKGTASDITYWNGE